MMNWLMKWQYIIVLLLILISKQIFFKYLIHFPFCRQKDTVISAAAAQGEIHFYGDSLVSS